MKPATFNLNHATARVRARARRGTVAVAVAVERGLQAARAAIEEIGKALTGAGIWNVGKMETKPKHMRFEYWCPGARCAQHRSNYEVAAPPANGITKDDLNGGGVAIDDAWRGEAGRKSEILNRKFAAQQLAADSTPCPVLGVLIRLVARGVLSKVNGRSGGVTWGLDIQLCRHTRSKMRVEFHAVKRETVLR